jgi:phospholipid/cholesterol/gamma-HCH transport system ATP-binding protein
MKTDMTSTPVVQAAVIAVDKVVTHFGSHVVYCGVTFKSDRSEIFALIGGGGSGESTLPREILLLPKSDAASIGALDHELTHIDEDDSAAPHQRWGAGSPHGGLFDALTFKANVSLPLRERTQLDDNLMINEFSMAKLAMTGLTAEVGAQPSSELSGGMLKRASLALDPELLFLDAGSMTDLSHRSEPSIRRLFGGARGRAAQSQERVAAKTQACQNRSTPSKPR